MLIRPSRTYAVAKNAKGKYQVIRLGNELRKEHDFSVNSRADDIETRQALSRSALLEGAYRHGDGLISPPDMRGINETALEFDTAPLSQGPEHHLMRGHVPLSSLNIYLHRI